MRKDPPLPRSEQGITIVLFSIFLFVLCSFLAFGLDVCRLYNERHKLQLTVDAATLAGLNALVAGTTYNDVVNAVTSNGNSNGALQAEILEVQPRCGTWVNDSFIPQPSGVCDNTSTAVEVTIARSVASGFGSILGLAQSTLRTRAVGYKPLYEPGNCIRPFGIENSYFTQLGLSVGSTFTVNGSQSAGNWGKLDINANASSGTAFTEAMLNNLCDDNIKPGSLVSTGTGSAQIAQVFETLLSDTTLPLASQSMIFAITTDFPSGNGTVEILKFIRVDLLSQRGSGHNWQATLRVVDLDAEPESAEPPKRDLME
jgi:hypothetical protein